MFKQTSLGYVCYILEKQERLVSLKIHMYEHIGPEPVSCCSAFLSILNSMAFCVMLLWPGISCASYISLCLCSRWILHQVTDGPLKVDVSENLFSTP